MNILIVEDEYLIADILSTMLKRNGKYTVFHAETIENALQALENDPEICLVDIRLNKENGIDFAHVLNKKEIPFIFITANNEMETIKKAALTKPQAYLTKPIKEKDLIATLEIIRTRFPKYVWIRTHLGKQKIKQSEILFIEADNVYAKIVCESKTYLERITLKEIEDLLEPHFVKVHRSFIVNKEKINLFKTNELRIRNHIIPISKKYQEITRNLSE